MAERIGQLLDLAGAGDGVEYKAVSVLLERLHRIFQLLQRAAQRAGQHEGDYKRGDQNQRTSIQNDTGHLPEAFVDGLVNITDADDAPGAARHFLGGVDDGVLDVGAVAQAGQTPGFLFLQPGVQKLLLWVVDHVAALVHQVAVAVLADTDVVDGGSQCREADVHRDPLPGRIFRHAAHDADDPGVVALEDRFDMGDADVPAPAALGRDKVERAVAQNVVARGAVLGPTVLQGTVGVVGGHGDDLAAGGLQGVQKSVAVLGRFIHRVHDKIHDLVDIVDIIADRPDHLADRLGAAGTRALNDGTAVIAQKCYSR